MLNVLEGDKMSKTMTENGFLRWMSSNTKSEWWNDSGDPDEVRDAIGNGATGVTLNPLLLRLTLFGRNDYWHPRLAGMPLSLSGNEKAEEIARIITCEIAKLVEPIFVRTKGASGFVCAQVDPGKAHDTAYMIEMAKRLHSWAPNIAVKLPATNAALDALEECILLGMTIVMTVSFTLSQVIAIAERYESVLARSKDGPISPGRCYAVIMIGRIDDFLREAAIDNRSTAKEEDIVSAGVAITKRAYDVFCEKRYKAILLPSGLRLASQAADLAGGELLFSLSPRIQDSTADFKEPFSEKVLNPVKEDVIARLLSIRDFARAFEPDGLKPEEFLGFAPTQRTLTQFLEAGWRFLETYKI
jgi:transaldolase